jgi:hypothetical protein
MTTKMSKKISKMTNFSLFEIRSKTEDPFDRRDGPPVLESARVCELLKCYKEKQAMILDPLMLKMMPIEKNEEAITEPVFIDFKTLTAILLKDLEAREIRQDIELTRIRREKLQEKLLLKQTASEKKIKMKYRILFEEFLLSLINSKQDEIPNVSLDQV